MSNEKHNAWTDKRMLIVVLVALLSSCDTASLQQADKIRALESQNKALEAEIEDLKAQMEAIQQEHKDYVNKYRTSAIGRKLDSIVTLDGKEFKDVTLKRVDDIGISMLHSVGASRVSYAQLDESWHEEFAYSPEAAEEQSSVEKAKQAQVAQMIAEQREALKLEHDIENESRAALADEKAIDSKIEKLSALIENHNTRISKNRQEISRRRLKQSSARKSGKISSASSRVPMLERENIRLKKEVSTARAHIRRLRTGE